MTPLKIKSDRSKKREKLEFVHVAYVEKPQIFEWTDHSVGLVAVEGVGSPITLPPKNKAEDKFAETKQRNGILDRVLCGYQRLLGKQKKQPGEETSDPEKVSNGLGDVRQHELLLGPDGLYIDGRCLRWIDISEISHKEHAIYIYVCPVRQGPDSYRVLKLMKTTYSLEVPAGQVPEIESAIRQFMKRWKPSLKGRCIVIK